MDGCIKSPTFCLFDLNYHLYHDRRLRIEESRAGAPATPGLDMPRDAVDVSALIYMLGVGPGICLKPVGGNSR